MQNPMTPKQSRRQIHIVNAFLQLLPIKKHLSLCFSWHMSFYKKIGFTFALGRMPLRFARGKLIQKRNSLNFLRPIKLNGARKAMLFSLIIAAPSTPQSGVKESLFSTLSRYLDPRQASSSVLQLKASKKGSPAPTMGTAR